MRLYRRRVDTSFGDLSSFAHIKYIIEIGVELVTGSVDSVPLFALVLINLNKSEKNMNSRKRRYV